MSVLAKLGEFINIPESDVERVLRNTCFKQMGSRNTPPAVISEDQFMAIASIAIKYRLNPLLGQIFAYPSKKGVIPFVGVDGWAQMVNDHPQYDGCEFIYSEPFVKGAQEIYLWIECAVYRKDRKKPSTCRELYKENVVPMNPVWQSHPNRKLRHNAFIQACRLAFSFSGIYSEDEALAIAQVHEEQAEGQDPAQKDEPEQVVTSESLKTYPKEAFERNKDVWVGKIKKGKQTMASIKKFLSDRGMELSQEQQKVLTTTVGADHEEN